jgi:beta-lactamase class A
MYSEADAGNVDLDSTYVLENADKVGGSGSMTYQPAGAEYTYRELLELMGQQSDNTAFNVCRNLLGEELIGSYIKSIGMTNTSLADNTTTPRDIGIYFKKLWGGKLVNKSDRDDILESLTDTIYEEYIPAGIPDLRVAHKFGKEVNVTNDAGIVFAAHPFVIVIMSKGIVDAEGAKIIPELAALVAHFENPDSPASDK